MKKILLFAFSMLFISVAVMAQEVDPLKDQLVGLGLNPTVVSLALGLLGLILGHVAVPQKWASILVLIEAALHWVNERTNKLSNKQRGIKVKFDAELKALKNRGIVIPTILLMLMFSMGANAQLFTGFWKPIEVNPAIMKMTKAVDADAPEFKVLIRPQAYLNATSVNFKGGEAETKALSSVGAGLSLSRFINVNEKPYCQVSVNALVLLGTTINQVNSTSIGGAVTIGLFNNLFNFGAGYIDKGFNLLVGTAVTF